jgi:hypothetical protein
MFALVASLAALVSCYPLAREATYSTARRVLEAEHAFDALQLSYDLHVPGAEVALALASVGLALDIEERHLSCSGADSEPCRRITSARARLHLAADELLDGDLQRGLRSWLRKRDKTDAFQSVVCIICISYLSTVVLGMVLSRLPVLGALLRKGQCCMRLVLSFVRQRAHAFQESTPRKRIDLGSPNGFSRAVCACRSLGGALGTSSGPKFGPDR